VPTVIASVAAVLSRRPPHRHPSPPAANRREIVRKHNEPKRYHPESENGQEPQRSAHHQRRARRNPANAGTRHGKAPFSDMEALRSVVDSEFHSILPFNIWPVDIFFIGDKPGKSGL
jgi:hypothetical protein